MPSVSPLTPSRGHLGSAAVDSESPPGTPSSSASNGRPRLQLDLSTASTEDEALDSDFEGSVETSSPVSRYALDVGSDIAHVSPAPPRQSMTGGSPLNRRGEHTKSFEHADVPPVPRAMAGLGLSELLPEVVDAVKVSPDGRKKFSILKINGEPRFLMESTFAQGGSGKARFLLDLANDRLLVAKQIALPKGPQASATPSEGDFLAEPSINLNSGDTFLLELADLQAYGQVDVHNLVRADDKLLATMEPMTDFKAMAKTICETGSTDTERAALATEVIIQLLADVCRILQRPHGAGVIHRDIKPDNLFCDSTGNIKLGDWGTALHPLNSAERPGGGLEYQYAGAADWQGTLAYIAPELFRREEASRFSDLYSLGATCIRVAGLALGKTYDHLGWSDYAGASSELPEEVAQILPASVAALLVGLTKQQPHDRPSLRDVRTTIARLGPSNAADTLRKLAQKTRDLRLKHEQLKDAWKALEPRV